MRAAGLRNYGRFDLVGPGIDAIMAPVLSAEMAGLLPRRFQETFLLLKLPPDCHRWAMRLEEQTQREEADLLRTYELVFITQPDLDEESLEALVERQQKVMTDNGAEIVKVEHMGQRRLAYPIQNHVRGHYVLIHAKMELTAIQELERSLKLSEDVLRHLVVRLDETE